MKTHRLICLAAFLTFYVFTAFAPSALAASAKEINIKVGGADQFRNSDGWEAGVDGSVTVPGARPWPRSASV